MGAVARRMLRPVDEDGCLPLLNTFPTDQYRDWSVLFRNGWNRIDDVVGVGVFDDGKAVGYLGTIQTERHLGGHVFRTVSLSTWYVLKEYRAHSMDLQRAVLEYDRCVVVGHTPIPQIMKRYDSLGYRSFDTNVRLLFPHPKGLFGMRDGVGVTAGLEAVSPHLTDVERTLVADHLPYGCVPMRVASTDGRSTILIAQRVMRRYKGFTLPTAHIVYLSDPAFFAEVSVVCRGDIMRHMRSRLIAMDARLYPSSAASFSMLVPLVTPRIYRSTFEIDTSLLDNLYSELVLFSF